MTSAEKSGIADHGLPIRPRLHRSYYLMAIPATDDLLLYREGRGVRLKPVGDPRLLHRLFELLDGMQPVEGIVELMADFDSNLIISSLKRLHEMRLLEDGPGATVPSEPLRAARDAQETLLSHLTSDPSSALAALAAATVVIFGDGAVSSSLSAMLVTSGLGQVRAPSASDFRSAGQAAPPTTVGVTPDGVGPFAGEPFPRAEPPDLTALLDGASLVVAALDHPDPGLLDTINGTCLDQAIPLLPIVHIGWEGHLGPTCIPGRTACLRCADLRAKANLSHYQQYLLYEEAMRARPGEQPFGRFPHFPGVLAGLAATEAIKLITSCYPPATHGRVVVIDLLMSETEVHDVLRVPRCPACGRMDRRARPTAPWQAMSAHRPSE